MPSDFMLKTVNGLHRGLTKATFGRFGWKLGKMPVVELTTIGRKSGEPRTVLLTSPLQLGDTWVVVASRGGDPTHPAWYLNLRDNPDVETTIRGKKEKRRARIVSPEEREKLWPQVTEAYKGYANYQTKTTREIPLVLLEPVS